MGFESFTFENNYEARVKHKLESEAGSFAGIEVPVLRVKPLRNIEWDNGARLEVEETGEIIVPREAIGILRDFPQWLKFEIGVDLRSKTYNLVYVTPEGQRINLNKILEDVCEAEEGQEIVFIGGDSFFAYDLDYDKSGPKRKTLIALDPDRLEEDQSYILAVLHEIGHAFVFRGEDESLIRALVMKKSDLDKLIIKESKKRGINKASFYKIMKEIVVDLRKKSKEDSEHFGWFSDAVKDISSAVSNDESIRSKYYWVRIFNRDIDLTLICFHERSAWAFVDIAIKRLKLKPSDLGLKDERQRRKIINDCLRSYNRARRTEMFTRLRLKETRKDRKNN